MASAIGDYALLGDCHSAALVGRDGSIDWWCAPRFDSRSAFARLLDPGAGHWSIRPSQSYEVERVYLEDTMVLQSTFNDKRAVERWTRERDAVHETVLRDGWSEEAGAYTGAFGSDNLDASVLLMAIMGFLPADDPRMRRTIDTIERELAQDGHVRRWTGAREGSFVICSFWLANALALAGELDRGEAVFDAVMAKMNDVGLLAEEIDPSSGDLIGNFPQAFSHVGLINAAWSIQQAREREERR
ncbi:MAG: glycoside hydrolase family 15 protein [Solirubrobacteraceae bacterium MAG38_C4-C5]|nr:glycoside hydrolase family 15 protein [Candidatus Siliceabacter maunaloa]